MRSATRPTPRPATAHNLFPAFDSSKVGIRVSVSGIRVAGFVFRVLGSGQGHLCGEKAGVGARLAIAIVGLIRDKFQHAGRDQCVEQIPVHGRGESDCHDVGKALLGSNLVLVHQEVAGDDETELHEQV